MHNSLISSTGSLIFLLLVSMHNSFAQSRDKNRLQLQERYKQNCYRICREGVLEPECKISGEKLWSGYCQFGRNDGQPNYNPNEFGQTPQYSSSISNGAQDYTTPQSTSPDTPTLSTPEGARALKWVTTALDANRRGDYKIFLTPAQNQELQKLGQFILENLKTSKIRGTTEIEKKGYCENGGIAFTPDAVYIVYCQNAYSLDVDQKVQTIIHETIHQYGHYYSDHTYLQTGLGGEKQCNTVIPEMRIIKLSGHIPKDRYGEGCFAAEEWKYIFNLKKFVAPPPWPAPRR